MRIERIRSYVSEPGSLAIVREGKPWIYLSHLPYYPTWALNRLWRESRLGRALEAWGRRRWP